MIPAEGAASVPMNIIPFSATDGIKAGKARTSLADAEVVNRQMSLTATSGPPPSECPSPTVTNFKAGDLNCPLRLSVSREIPYRYLKPSTFFRGRPLPSPQTFGGQGDPCPCFLHQLWPLTIT